MEKMNRVEQNNTRIKLYGLVREALEEAGYHTETVVGGAIIHLENDHYAQISVVIKDPEKFNLTDSRVKYAEQQTKSAELAEKRRIKAEKDAKRLAESAAKANEVVGE